jgi:hypothetical protein
MHLGRSASLALLFQMYKTQDAERPGYIPTESVGTSSGSYLEKLEHQVKIVNIYHMSPKNKRILYFWLENKLTFNWGNL